MKYICTILAVIIGLSSQAQSGLVYDKKFTECEDQWVAFSITKDSTYPYGFIYIDETAGLTFDLAGFFTIGADGKFSPKKIDSASMKYRLEPNDVKVAIIPATRFIELKVDAVPDWLAIYKTTNDSVARMVRWGYYYNHWQQSAKALTYLEKAYRLKPDQQGLAFELSYAYNALGQFGKAITVLEEAVKRTPADCLLYKELSFAELHLDQTEKAASTCKKGIAACEDKGMKAEIAYNMAYHYFKKSDKDNFTSWATETKKWATADDQFNKNINWMGGELKK